MYIKLDTDTTLEPVADNQFHDVYGDPSKYICCVLPQYVNGTDGTHCYYADGREVIVEQSMRRFLRNLLRDEGWGVSPIRPVTGAKPSYTDPRTYGPHMTMAFLKVRQPIGRDIVYGQFNVILPESYRLKAGKTPDTCYISYGDFEPIMVYHSMQHTQRKLREALQEHMYYMRRWFAYMKLTRSRCVVSELFYAWDHLAHK